MILTELALNNYRNYKRAEISSLSHSINLILGENAQGKTNLLEAVYFLSCGRSFRTSSDQKLIREGSEGAYLKAAYKTAYSSGKIEAALLSDKKKSIKLNGIPVKKMSDVIGRLNTVLFAPEDLKTVKEAPSLRRRLIDIEISKLSPLYYVTLQRYASAVKEKNVLLKERQPSFEIIDAYNEQIALYGSKIIEKRREYLRLLSSLSSTEHEKLTGGKEALTIRYKSCAEGEDIYNELKEKLTVGFEREKINNVSLIGPHREDLEILINGADSKTMASQGQQRTAMISVKLACAYAAKRLSGETPVLLLDDVFSELDNKRIERLLSSVENFQVFITSTDLRADLESLTGKIIKVVNGSIF